MPWKELYSVSFCFSFLLSLLSGNATICTLLLNNTQTSHGTLYQPYMGIRLRIKMKVKKLQLIEKAMKAVKC